MNLYGQSCPEHSSKGSSVLDEDSIGNIAKQKLGAYCIQQLTRMGIERGVSTRTHRGSGYQFPVVLVGKSWVSAKALFFKA